MPVSTAEQHAFERLAQSIGYANKVEYQVQEGHMVATILEREQEGVQQLRVYRTTIWGYRGPRTNGHTGQGNHKPRTAAQRAKQSKAMKAYWASKRRG